MAEQKRDVSNSTVVRVVNRMTKARFTMAEIAAVLQLSRQRIYQIMRKAEKNNKKS